MIGAAGASSAIEPQPDGKLDSRSELGCDASGGRTNQGTDALVRGPASTAEGPTSDSLAAPRTSCEGEK